MQISVIYFKSYLELMTLLEEDFCGVWRLGEHSLFRKNRKFMVGSNRERSEKSESTALETVRDMLQLDPHKQYDRGIDIPCVKARGKQFKTLPNMQDAKMGEALSDMRLYNEAFAFNAERLTKSIDSLFNPK